MEIKPHPKKPLHSELVVDNLEESVVLHALHSDPSITTKPFFSLTLFRNRNRPFPQTYTVPNTLMYGLSAVAQETSEQFYRATGGRNALPAELEAVRLTTQAYVAELLHLQLASEHIA